MLSERVFLWLTCALVAVLPFAHVTGLRNFLAGLLALGVIAHFLRRRQLMLPSPFMLLWLLVAAASCVGSVAPSLAFGDVLVHVFLPLAVGVAVATHTDQRWVRDVPRALFLGICFVLFIRLAYQGLPQPAPDWAEKLYGYWPGRGVMSTLAILALPLASWLVVSGRKALGWGLLLIAVVAGAQNWNRMFWLSAWVTLLPCLFMGGMNRQRRLLVAALLLVAVAVGGYVSMKMLRAQQSGTAVVSSTVQEDPRWAIWQSWAVFAVEHPWLGHGFGPRVTSQLGVPRMPESLGQGIHHPHNIFLSIFFQTGLLGLTTYLLLLGDLVRRFACRLRDRQYRVAALAGLASIIGLVSKNMTDDFGYFSVALLFWVLIAFFAREAGFFAVSPPVLKHES